MDLDTLDWLQSQAGCAALAVADSLELSEASLLADVERLRRTYAPELARALAEQVRLRRRAAARFPEAGRMFFSAEALEQATAAVVANYRASRFVAGTLVADLGCGLGGDTRALAQRGPVLAVERDPLRLALAQANLRALGLEQQVRFEQRDLLLDGLPVADALFCDPARRLDGRRVFNSEHYQPPLSVALNWRTNCAALALKLAPGIDPAVLPPEIELEFVSRDGELKEAVAWCGTLVRTNRCATLLRGEPVQQYQLIPDAAGSEALPLSEPLAVLYDPDPAVTRAGLVATLGRQLGAAQLDPDIAYLTADHAIPTPFARIWPVIDWLPWGLKRLRARLRELAAGAVTVKKRGSPLDTDALARQLRGDGSVPLVVVLTRLRNRPIAIICGEPLTNNQ